MKKFEILKIEALVYERFVTVKEIDSNKILNLYFVEYGETIGECYRREIGEIIEGEISIWLGNNIKTTSLELMFLQSIENSPHLEAVVEVKQLLDERSFYAISSIQKKQILIEVEEKIDLKEGDRIYLKGELKIELKEYI